MFTKINTTFSTWMERLKKISVVLGTWGFIFAVVTIAGFRVGYDYDDTLVFSAPAFEKAGDSGAIINSPDYWRTLNQSYDIEKTKILPYLSAWFLKIMGFRISVISERGSIGAEALVKLWKPLVSDFYFVPGQNQKYVILAADRYVLYFGDSDSDILQARQSEVVPLRIKRSKKSGNKADYSPGKLREIVIPLSD